MSTTGNLSEAIAKAITDLSERREQIKEEYIRAWLASVVPDENLNTDWLIQNVELVEKRSDDGRTITWYLQKKS